MHLGVTCAAMRNLDSQIWKSRVSISTEQKLYNTCILVFYPFSCTALSAGQLPREMQGLVVPESDGAPFRRIFLSRIGAPVNIVFVCHSLNADTVAFHQISSYY